MFEYTISLISTYLKGKSNCLELRSFLSVIFLHQLFFDFSPSIAFECSRCVLLQFLNVESSIDLLSLSNLIEELRKSSFILFFPFPMGKTVLTNYWCLLVYIYKMNDPLVEDYFLLTITHFDSLPLPSTCINQKPSLILKLIANRNY